ncbi:pentapeptide repeat-containing protein [Actinomadura rubrisoli]|uniref:pentapeptide repeat-containing protein n=1 Tax=Actinomadura rubrisoli TaxID=2530368 RepID=UPI001A9D3C89|nr:pentapeptide repeat-containing protein [Actinomadura rubrisoli]
MLVILPGLLVDHDLAGARVDPKDRLSAVNNVRGTLLQAVVGMVVLFGAYSTWRQFQINREGLAATREGQVTDRFSRAVDQLGSDKLDVRIRGLYALWRIADHSPGDQEAVISILTAFIRTHLPWPPQDDQPSQDALIDTVRPVETRTADAQVALTGLGVLNQNARRPDWLNLSLTDLRRADCDGLWLHAINFDHSCLESASFYEGNLSRASLVSANLRRAVLTRAILRQFRCVSSDLREANLVEADLTDADLSACDLRGAILRKARTHGTTLVEADLRSADLRGTDLSTANLDRARLEGAMASDLTRWPPGFEIQAHRIVDQQDPGRNPHA